jgi:mRNA interferase MazF
VVIRQGDVFWVDLGQPSGSGPGFLHPHVVIQNDVFNRSRLQTVVVCGITSSFRQTQIPGNVALSEGEANLPKPSVVNVSQLFTVDKEDLVEKIGALSKERMQEVLEGVYLLLEPREVF